jgi:predicted SAM-dependent methyltransferase
LRPGGRFRFVLPDLEYHVKQYIANPSQDAALEFMKDTYLGHEHRAKGFRGFVMSWLGNSQHLWMWDYGSIAMELEKSGFVDTRRATFGDSSDPMFEKAEDEDRWTNCLGIECTKPAPGFSNT